MSIMHFANPSMVAGAVVPAEFIWDTTPTQINLVSPFPAENTNFGEVIDSARTGKDRIVIGVVNKDVGADTSRGQSYVYHLESGSWSLEQTLESPNAGNTFYGNAVCMSDDGTKMVVSQAAAGSPTQANVFFYERDVSTNVWSLSQTLETDYSGGTVTNSSKMSSDGVVLVLGDNASTGTVEVWRLSGSTYTREQTMSGTSNLGAGLAISRDGRVIAMTRHGLAQTQIWYDSTGAGAWALRETLSGQPTQTPRDRPFDLNDDGTILCVVDQSADDFNIYLWDNISAYNLISAVDMSPSALRVCAISTDGKTIMGTVDTGDDATLLTAEGNGTSTYEKTNEVAPAAPIAGVSRDNVMSNDGYLAIIGNQSWNTGGRLVIYTSAKDHVEITDQDVINLDFMDPNVASYDLRSDGRVTFNGTGTAVSGQWWTGGVTASIGDGYEAFVEELTISGTAVAGGDAFDTWVSLSSDRSWSMTQTGSGSGVAVFRVSIRDSTTQIVLASTEVSIGATVA